MKKIIISILILLFTFSISYGQSGEGSPAMKVQTSDESVNGRCRELTIQGLQFSQDTGNPSKFTLKGASDVAPDSATYITQTSNATLTNEQALSTLSTGLMTVTTGTGVVSSIAYDATPFLSHTGSTDGTPYYLMTWNNDADTGFQWYPDLGSPNNDYWSIRYDGLSVFSVDRQGHISSLSNINNCAIHFTIDGGQSVITTGIKSWIRIPFSMTISGGWELTTDVIGNIRIDVWKDTYANYPPDNSDAMPIPGNEPAIIAGIASRDTSVAGDWNITTLAEGDYIQIYVDSADTCTKAYLTLIGTKVQ